MRTPLFDHSGKRLTLNPAFIRKYFPNGGIRLTECADRTQGLMPPPGTPWASVVWRTCSGMGCASTARKALAPGFSSTTCAKGTAWIYGYDREEFTHTSLAAQIAAGTADAGMGFFSAAQLYSPDLLPACMSDMTCSSPIAPSTPPWCSGCRAASPPGLSPTSSASRCWRPGTTSVPGFPGQTRALSTRGAAPTGDPENPAVPEAGQALLPVWLSDGGLQPWGRRTGVAPPVRELQFCPRHGGPRCERGRAFGRGAGRGERT